MALTLCLLTFPSRAGFFLEDSSHLLCVGIGAAEVLDSPQGGNWCIELRPGWEFYHLKPWLFYGSGKEDYYYAAVGVLMDISLGRGWVLTPSFGGGYYDSSGFTLGYHTEFRSAIELSRRFWGGHRLGVMFCHISNGSLGKTNPGTETLGMIYSFPLNQLFGRSRRNSSKLE